MDWIQSQARVWNGIPVLSPKYRSVVHLEDQEDQPFWDSILQRVRPGKYMFITYSKSEKGNNTTGCEQCLKFKPYLSSNFFICIDSDLRNLMGEADLDADHYVIQTYTYSWENHICEAHALHSAVRANAVGSSFDFMAFLSSLSAALYKPLLLLLYCKRTGNSYLDELTFRHILKTQCSGAEVQNDGQGYVSYIYAQFATLLSGATAIGFDPAAESAYYAAKGLMANNAYLHVRGHNLYDLVAYIGKMLCRPLRISFAGDVLSKVPVGGTYKEYQEIENDLRKI